jgi:acetyl/propionyl-CoA carboxylase alpha subunit
LRANAGSESVYSQGMDRLTAAMAEDLLAEAALVPAMSGSITDMKKLRERCLEAGIPVLVGCPPGAGKG